MKDLIESYGINFDAFRSLIRSHVAIVAGSSALHGYLLQEGIPPTFEPGDIDIWLYPYSSEGCDCGGCIRDFCAKNKGQPFDAFDTFLTSYGFQNTQKFDTNELYMREGIFFVVSYTNLLGKEIQLIIVNSDNLVQYIQQNFDLSICASWWDGEKFHTMNSDTKKGIAHIMNCPSGILTEKQEGRVEKYKARGFVITEMPCPYRGFPDTRYISRKSPLRSILAHDIFELEDINAAEFLEKSQWNILVKCGDSWSAYNRMGLMEYMYSKGIYYNMTFGYVCDTPFKQSLSNNYVDIFRYSDYSIYELIYDGTLVDGDVCKTLYSIRAYTTHGWHKKEWSYSGYPPSAEHASNKMDTYDT